MTDQQIEAAARELFAFTCRGETASVEAYVEILREYWGEGRVMFVQGRAAEVLPWGNRFRITQIGNPLYKLAKSRLWYREANMDEVFTLDDWTWPTEAEAAAFLAQHADQ